jgi:hypothetical protein
MFCSNNNCNKKALREISGLFQFIKLYKILRNFLLVCSQLVAKQDNVEYRNHK